MNTGFWHLTKQGRVRRNSRFNRVIANARLLSSTNYSTNYWVKVNLYLFLHPRQPLIKSHSMDKLEIEILRIFVKKNAIITKNYYMLNLDIFIYISMAGYKFLFCVIILKVNIFWNNKISISRVTRLLIVRILKSRIGGRKKEKRKKNLQNSRIRAA